jgi:hypothetical protein
MQGDEGLNFFGATAEARRRNLALTSLALYAGAIGFALLATYDDECDGCIAAWFERSLSRTERLAHEEPATLLSRVQLATMLGASIATTLRLMTGRRHMSVAFGLAVGLLATTGVDSASAQPAAWWVTAQVAGVLLATRTYHRRFAPAAS